MVSHDPSVEGAGGDRMWIVRTPDSAEVYPLAIDEQLPVFIDQHREMLGLLLDGLTDEEARRSLVPSTTTLLGLVKHAAFVERVWFGQAVTGRSRTDLGIAADPEESFGLVAEDTISSVLADHQRAVTESREAVAPLSLDDELPGNRRGPLPLRWVYLHVLRELAQHCGHGDILREQVLASRDSAPRSDQGYTRLSRQGPEH